MRREFSEKTKGLAALRAKGRCESALVPQLTDIGCNRWLATGDFFYEHINPDGLTGEPTLDNCAVLCRTCWKIKTASYDIPKVAQAKRRERKHWGIKPKSTFPCSRDSQWKKTFNHGVVRR